MTRNEQALRLLYQSPMTAVRLTAEMGCHEVVARRCLSDLRNRLFVVSTKPYPKIYSLTETGREEVVRLKQGSRPTTVMQAIQTQTNSVFALGAM